MNLSIGETLHNYIKENIDDETKLHDFGEFLHDFFEKLPEEHYSVKEALAVEFEEFAEEITEEMVSAVLAKLKTRDGQVAGIKWTIDETNSVAKQYDVKNKIEACGKKFHEVGFYFAMNYVYAVHFNPNRTVNGYIELACDLICNANMCFKSFLHHIIHTL